MMAVSKQEIYISVDVETAGPNPGGYALLSIGACVAHDLTREFYCELQPDRNGSDPDALSIHGLALERLALTGTPPEEAMESFAQWIARQVPPGGVPICVAFNAAFDWMFLNEYFHRYLGRNPFGHNALDIKALYMGLRRSRSFRGLGSVLRADYPDFVALSHNALRDAQDQARLFQDIYNQLDATET